MIKSKTTTSDRESLRQLECQGLGRGDPRGGQAASGDCKLLGLRERIIFEVGQYFETV